MTITLRYAGYEGRAEYDSAARRYHGQVSGLRDVITFHGSTLPDLRAAFQDSVDDYLEFCRERDEVPEQPR